MPRSTEEFQLDKLLQRESSRAPESLPDGFASVVLRQAVEVRRLAIRHWKVLTAGSFVALFLAVSLSYYLARDFEGSSSLPRLDLFRSEAGEFQVAPNQ